VTHDYYILRPLVQSKQKYQKQEKEEKLNQYIFDDKLYPALVFEKFDIKHDGSYSPIDMDDFKRGDFWFCTYDDSIISQEKYEKMKSILSIDDWYNWENEYRRWSIPCKIKYFFKSLNHRLTRK